MKAAGPIFYHFNCCCCFLAVAVECIVRFLLMHLFLNWEVTKNQTASMISVSILFCRSLRSVKKTWRDCLDRWHVHASGHQSGMKHCIRLRYLMFVYVCLMSGDKLRTLFLMSRQAWSSIVYQLIPNVQQLETNLRNFAQIIEADEVLLFERATFLVRATTSMTVCRTEYLDPEVCFF